MELLKELKAHAIYLTEYLYASEKIENILSSFLAIAASSSIAGWVIWKNYAFVWAVVIVVSQVITAVKPFLPFRQRIKPLRALSYAFEELTLEVEREWFNVAEGKLSEREINAKIFDFKGKKLKILKTTLGDVSLPFKKKWHLQAQEIATEYFKNNY